MCVCVCVLTYLLENSLRKSCFFCSDRLNFFSVSVNFIAHSLLVEKQRCFNVPKLRHLFAAWISVWQVKQSRDERPFLQHVIPNLDGDLFRACLRARGFRLNGTALCERAELLGVHRFARVAAELAPKVLRVASKLQLVPRKIVGRLDKEPGCGAVDKEVIQTVASVKERLEVC